MILYDIVFRSVISFKTTLQPFVPLSVLIDSGKPRSLLTVIRYVGMFSIYREDEYL